MKLGIVPILGKEGRRPDLRVLRLRALVFFPAIAVVMGACSPGGSSAKDGRLKVVAGFYPLAEAAVKVGGNLVDVQNLTPPGVEPHDLELTPSEIASIQDADVVLFLSHGFAPAVEQAVGDARGIKADLLQGLSLRRGVPEGEKGPVTDPHVWLDPVLYQQVVARTERALAQAKPAEAATFQSNLKAFQTQLGQLDQEYRSGLTGCPRKKIVTSHAAFGYLSTRYGLTQDPISGISPDAEPSPQRLAELAQLVKRDGVTTIFTEELVSPKVAQTLAREAGVSTAVLNPLEGLTKQELSAGQDYVSVMRSNLHTLEKALGCPAA
jgi:zinc transport system substrate-binding protein